MSEITNINENVIENVVVSGEIKLNKHQRLAKAKEEAILARVADITAKSKLMH